jgi:DNA repair protein RecN (Recombination protein N)
LEELVQSESARLREIERLEHESEELDNAAIKEGEEEELFAEYTLLANAEERSDKAREIYNGLTADKGGALGLLRKQKALFEQLECLDGTLSEAANLHRSALVELEEVGYLLNQYQSRIETSPDKSAAMEERLKLINTLKKKYGGSVQEVIAYRETIKKRLSDLENADHQIEALRAELAKAESENDQKAAALTKKRHEASSKLADAVQKELSSLNMPKALFYADLVPQPRTGAGDEKIEFFLAPNVGEHRIPVKDCASGGELSRLMLALQTLLAGKASIPTLVFDEIDANVGGATAVVVGEKLKRISRQHQVLCITHFPQVAQYSDHHLQISKTETEDARTVTLVTALDKKSRAKELNRMSGK